MKKSGSFFCLFLFFTIPYAKSAEAPVVVGTGLKDLGRIALEHSPVFISAKSSFDVSHLQTKNSNVAFMPSLDLTSSIGPQGFSPDYTPANTYLLNPESNWSSSTQLALTESLYDNGESLKQLRISELAEKQNALQLQRVRGQVLLDVVRAYCDFSYSVMQLQFTQKYSAEIERQFKLVTSQFHQGVKTRSDFLRFQTNYQRSQLDVIAAIKKANDDRTALLKTLGLPQDDALPITAMPGPQIFNKVLDLQLSSDDLFEAKILQIKKQVSDEQVALVASRNYPQLFLTGAIQYGSSYYYQTGFSWNDNQQTSWNVLLSLKFNLWDWGTRSRNTQIQALQENIAQQDLRTQLFSAEQDLATFKHDQLQLADRQKISSSLEQNELVNYKQLDQDYRVGSITYLDLTQGLSELLDAQSRKLRVDFDSFVLYTQWKYFKGVLNEESLEQ